MRFQFSVMAIGLLILFFFASAGGSMALAQQDANNQGQPLMTPVNEPVANGSADSRQSLVDQLDLKMYEAAVGDLSMCTGDKGCVGGQKALKSWFCAADVCEGKDKTKKALDCFEMPSNKYSKEKQDNLNSAICSLIKSPGAETRQAVLAYSPNPNTKKVEDHLVEYGAYFLALKGSAPLCENYIKNYVGAYGPQWNYEWYRAMSVCRIFAHERTREQEEKDFYTWFAVVQGLGNCSDIVNTEMRDACSAIGAASPLPSPTQPPVNAQ